jgi:hypothetical protein
MSAVLGFLVAILHRHGWVGHLGTYHDGHLTPGRLRLSSYKRWFELTRTDQNPHSLSSHLINTPHSPSQTLPLNQQPCSSPPFSLSSLLPSPPRPPSLVSPLPSASPALWRSALPALCLGARRGAWPTATLKASVTRTARPSKWLSVHRA